MLVSKYDVNPTRIDAMRAAFRTVCLTMQFECESDNAMTNIIVTKIVGIATAGEFNPDRISSQVLAELAEGAPTRRACPAALPVRRSDFWPATDRRPSPDPSEAPAYFVGSARSMCRRALWRRPGR
jgi:hypothetical protein